MLQRSLGLLAFLVALGVQPAGADDPKPKEKGKANRLARESSPYLLQHAHNPVDWYPWGQEAFERAKKEKKLVFLSIGYSSCHWCHVMERESFSSAEIAKVMNDNFVCIKVDREERPDVDDIYMTALNVTGQQGGWPLTMILTADGKPIFGGTYFPPEDKKVGDDTAPGMKSILATVIDLDKKSHDELVKQADHVAKLTVDALDRNSRGVALGKLDRELLDAAADAYDFDPEHGGTGSKARSFRGTKFPRPPVWQFLLSQSKQKGKDDLAKHVHFTLHKMAEGGIYDHLGGGFHRYSTERTWTVPHFEKMLYDNAQLVELYSDAYAATPDPSYKRVVEETLAFVKREMTSPDGAFYSALDADSNQKEGEFYVWTADEIAKVLGSEADAKLLKAVYGVTAPNFEEKFSILRLPKALAEVAKDQKLTEAELFAKLAPLKAKLFEVRAKRERPFLDTKVICAWNGQMIAGYARAGQVFANKEYVAAAARAAEFLLTKMRDKDGRLYRLYAAVPGEKPTARGTAFLDDYAYLVHGLLNLHDATGEAKWLDAAKQLTDTAIKFHGDGDRGGFFFAPSDGEKLFARAKDGYDGVQPSGNSQTTRNLIRLGAKLKDATYRERAEKTLKGFALTLRTNPGSVPAMALALHEFLATGGAAGTATDPKADPAKKPKESADVVTAKLTAGEPADGTRTVTLTLTVADGWHVYANPVGSDDLLESQTRVSVFVDGIEAKADVAYPKGKAITDTANAKYGVYEGTVTITATVPAGKDAAIEARVKVIACKEGTCLLPSTLKVK
ncbi:thioredoxin domain-containing protein : Thioredoxin domain protein OS=Singulisphaera acidiphila (strain ATCC BAA-1392 / DSM 18658 / VKM B-2454 / MOB10) GN=Sinac_5043 PE=4 SV=1: Thioredox_DsbH: DsbC [Gemmataceae bacterium]|nr:thioredoxin domain-containing protein : Thioredoxin domain protein OS=Singulisphaera acidiphila (strain ATCC BAA-1392 / DSM 18658 / VKM B-2454 / MOB10) GN=Sinac_5043 PE=4 SV=1: Thioredox_DsbH: DsbC [Gemmataceae bacterium]VTT96385.1 thioredoxin domain-containing protein : Thioredoxin domain protein OS=Singulisphaera acidiphila (strain ATCC BAA-1392 / DSM 18658 / VKM B-2454 / MOB10) GN=Sinac_5043 PE=4 SV=1: Thioredox_DsbH: DsbC [Gemmataceae bacterium]